MKRRHFIRGGAVGCKAEAEFTAALDRGYILIYLFRNHRIEYYVGRRPVGMRLPELQKIALSADSNRQASLLPCPDRRLIKGCGDRKLSYSTGKIIRLPRRQWLNLYHNRI